MKEERLDLLALFVNGNWKDHNDLGMYRSVHQHVMESILAPSDSASATSATGLVSADPMSEDDDDDDDELFPID